MKKKFMLLMVVMLINCMNTMSQATDNGLGINCMFVSCVVKVMSRFKFKKSVDTNTYSKFINYPYYNVVVYKGKNNRVKKLEIYYFVSGSECDAGIVNNNLEDNLTSLGMNPVRIKINGKPYDRFNNKYKGGKYAHYIIGWPEYLDGIPFNRVIDEGWPDKYIKVIMLPTI